MIARSLLRVRAADGRSPLAKAGGRRSGFLIWALEVKTLFKADTDDKVGVWVG